MTQPTVNHSRLSILLLLCIPLVSLHPIALGATKDVGDTHTIVVSPKAQTLRKGFNNHSEESYAWGMQFLICIAGAKFDGATLSDAMGQCSAPDQVSTSAE